MKNGYKFFWTDFALEELSQTISYLELNFTDKEIQKLAVNLEKILNLISENPNSFPVSDIKKEVHRVVILKYNTMYYRVKNETVEILSFFSNRQNPKKRNLR